MPDGVPEAVFDGVVDNGRRSRFQMDSSMLIAAMLPGVANDGVFDERVGVVAGIPKADHGPVTRGRRTQRLIAIRVTSDRIILERGKDDVLIRCTYSPESAVDVEVRIVAKLDHHAWVKSQRRSLVNNDAPRRT